MFHGEVRSSVAPSLLINRRKMYSMSLCEQAGNRKKSQSYPKQRPRRIFVSRGLAEVTQI